LADAARRAQVVAHGSPSSRPQVIALGAPFGNAQ
jgi:hypothetical protein